MSDTRTIQPAQDRRVRKPFTNKLLDPSGEPVGWNGYWERLLLARDVVEVPGAQAADQKPKPAAAADLPKVS